MRTVRAIATLLALLSGGASLASSAEADDEPLLTVYWDPAKFTHGEPFQLECQNGSYLIGFEGQAGAWIDRLRLVCAPWNAERGKLERPVAVEETQIGQSPGGEPTREVCPVGSGIAGDYDEHYARDESIYVLHTLEFYCVRAADGMRPLWRKFGSTGPLAAEYDRPRPHAGCPEGNLATGIYGRSGQFIDRLFGFVCRHRPTASPVAESKPNKEAEYKNPRIGGTKRIGGVQADGVQPNTPPPPPPPAVKMTKTTADVDVLKVPDGEKYGGDADFLAKGTEAPVLIDQPGWCKLKLDKFPFVIGGEGWVTATYLENCGKDKK